MNYGITTVQDIAWVINRDLNPGNDAGHLARGAGSRPPRRMRTLPALPSIP